MVMGVGRDGGMADEMVVPERCLVRLPSGVDVRDACLIEPLAVAVCGLRRLDWKGRPRAAVVGGGSIGLCAVAAGCVGGASIALEARHEAQREAGRRLGAVGVEGEYDVVVDAAGTADSLERCVSLCRPGATLLLLATYWNGLSLPSFEVTDKGLSILASSMYAQRGLIRDIDAAAAMLARRTEISEILITHRLPLEAAAEGFATAARRDEGAIKVVLEPRS
jgi:threonine dehydrogenase-like Zn-dependent dehydrogenase